LLEGNLLDTYLVLGSRDGPESGDYTAISTNQVGCVRRLTLVASPSGKRQQPPPCDFFGFFQISAQHRHVGSSVDIAMLLPIAFDRKQFCLGHTRRIQRSRSYCDNDVSR
jgi:hypothetical protein